jgi:hypothetical protein
MEAIIKMISNYTGEMIFQTNLGHGGELGERASVSFHVSCLKKLGGKISVHEDHTKYPLILWEK